MLTSGSRIGVYEIIVSLGAGGMGEVYRARDTRLGRDVALKILPPTFSSDPDRLMRFEREARTLASLNHPHIAQIYGVEGSESGGASERALVMELVEGEDLSERLRRGPIPLDEALLLARQIAEALEAAHDAGIIHRDLKPANIKVREDGTVKVLDFGLAKAGGAGAAGGSGPGRHDLSPATMTSPAMTMQGVILGTAAYMAPEQAKGKPVDRRADIWAFGCVFYEMLAGLRAFEGDDVSDTLAAILRADPDWTKLPPLPPAMRVCDAAQPATISWEATGLLLGMGSDGVLQCDAGGGTPQQIIAAADGEIILGPQFLSGGKAVLFTVGKLADTGTARWERAQVVVQLLETGTRRTVVAAGSNGRLLPSGHLIYLSDGLLFAARFDPETHEMTSEPVPVVEGVARGTGGSAQLSVAHSGSPAYIPGPAGSVSDDREVLIGDRAGVVTRMPLPPGPFQHVRVSRDGTRLALGTDDGKDAIVWIYALDGTDSMQRLTLEGANRFPIWSPDGQWIAFQSSRGGDTGVYRQRADGSGGAERLTTAETGEVHIPESWSPDGKHVSYAVRTSTTSGVEYSLWTLALAERRAAAFGGVKSIEPLGSVFSQDGRWLAYTASSSDDVRVANRGIFVQPFPATGLSFQARQVLSAISDRRSAFSAESRQPSAVSCS